MALDFSQVKKWSIPVNGTNKEVVSVSVNESVLWKSGGDPYITFSSTNSFSVLHTYAYSTSDNNNGTIQYSTDKVNWVNWNSTSANRDSSTISSVNNKLYVRQINGSGKFGRRFYFASGSNITISGELRSLINANDMDGITNYGTNTFRYLFKNQSAIIDVSGLILPTTTVNYMYQDMFVSCDNLVNAGFDFKVDTIKFQMCYEMFMGCSSLTQAPKMKAVTICGDGCAYMFYGCSSLQYAPNGLSISSIITGSGDYYGGYHCRYMFMSCSSLRTIVPITISGSVGVDTTQSFAYMYSGCGALTQIGKILITGSVSSDAFEGMFDSVALYTTSSGTHTKAWRLPYSGTITSTMAMGWWYIDDDLKKLQANTTYYIGNSIEIV